MTKPDMSEESKINIEVEQGNPSTSKGNVKLVSKTINYLSSWWLVTYNMCLESYWKWNM